MGKGTSALRVKILVAAASVAVATTMVFASSAAAANNFGAPYDVFNFCPVDDPAMLSAVDEAICITSVADGGEFTIGDTTTELEPVTTQWGQYSMTPGEYIGVAALDGNTVDAEPSTVPGGLLDLSGNVPPGPLGVVAQTADDTPVTSVTATAEMAGTAVASDVLSAMVPIKIHLENPVLGPDCYIGSDDDPIVLNLSGAFTPETTISPLDPIAGFPSLLALKATNMVFSDSAFSVPEARGCGPGGLLDGLVNERAGLPSPSGENAMTLDPVTGFVVDVFGVAEPGQVLSDALHSTE